MSRGTSAAPAVIVVHGALGSAGQLAPVAEALRAERAYPAVLAVELPGHGHRPLAPGEPFTMPAFARAIASAIAAAGVHRPLVFGYSMGGYAALLLEHLAPGTVGGIVTLGTVLHWTPTTAERAAARLDAATLRTKVPAFAETLAERHQQAGGWELLLQRTAALLHTLGEAPPLTDQVLAGIHCPVHLLVGDRDDSVTLEETTRAASHLPHARVALLPDTPHPIERVSPALLAAELRDLASSVTPG